ncbi:MAG: ABC transporter permease [Betaproteobacteria bacterium]|nr:ABC transporter permease [Betaproteobacteria bacterium]
MKAEGSGFRTLLYKEVLRFWKVAFQTVGAPVLSAVLYLVIFGHVLAPHVRVYGEIEYIAFIVPGLVMMSVLQNAFANSSSSLIQSKVTGNIVFVLLPPISHREFYCAYVVAAATRGVLVGFGVWAVSLLFVQLPLANPLWILVFTLLGGALLGTLGMIAGIWADKFDQLATFQNFLIMPLTMLAGVFYSVHALPPFWRSISRLNPFFFMIDGFRYGFLGVSDMSPWLSFSIVVVFLAVTAGLTLQLLARGWKLRG